MAKRDLIIVKDIANRLIEIETKYRDGFTDAEMAEYLGVSQATLYSWIDPIKKPDKVYRDFTDARDNGKSTANEALECVAFQWAAGKLKREKIVVSQYEGSFKQYKYIDNVAPNEGLLKMLLMNRMPHKYKDTKNIDFTGIVETKNRLLSDLSDSDLQMYKNLLTEAIRDYTDGVPDDEEEVPIDASDY